MVRTVTVALVLTALLATGCANREEAPGTGEPGSTPGVEESGAQSLPDSLAHLRDQIRELVGSAEATDVAGCRALAFGAKPCGGPWSYLIFSTEVTDSTALADLVRRYNGMEDRLNREEERASDCALVQRPRLGLEGGRCVAVP